MPRPLTPKQQRFVEEYLLDLNATAAAGRAGYKDPNKGRQLVTKSNVASAIQAGKQVLSERSQITKDHWLKELALIGFADPGLLFDFSAESPKLKPACDISAEGRRLIASLEIRYRKQGRQTVAVPKVKLWDKLSALEKLGKHFGWLKDRLDLEIKGPPFKVYMGFDPQEVVCPPPQ